MRPLPRASDALIDHLRCQILTRELPLGFQLPPEAELIELYGASRAALRDALRQLEIEGLLLMRRGRNGGAIVRYPDLTAISRSLASVFTIREVPVGDYVAFSRLIEPEVAAQAAKNATPEQRENLTKLAELRTQPLGRLDAVSPSFHAELARSSGNGIYSTLLESLQPVLEGELRVRVFDEGHDERTRADHVQIAQAIQEGDAGGARRYMDAHVLKLENFLNDHGMMSDPVVPPEAWTRLLR
ncbi:MAG TPA: FCD domain-containing protein [Solirubrobacteraceae bacterium]|nr:FCD domain-containing protein [Solirubrobacteraceae bacterium]